MHSPRPKEHPLQKEIKRPMCDSGYHNPQKNILYKKKLKGPCVILATIFVVTQKCNIFFPI